MDQNGGGYGQRKDATSPPGGSGYGSAEVLPVTLAGQTSFTIAAAPNLAFEPILFVNGAEQRRGVGEDYTISGTTLTWLDNDFTLATTDTLELYYST